MADPDSTSRIAPRLRVVVSDGHGQSVRAPGLAAWLARVAPRSVNGEVAVALVSDARIRALNKRFRHKDKPTDVLSFPSENRARASHLAPHAAPRTSHLAPRSLGDIVISTMTARRQAIDAGHSYVSELKVLALHGLLHLLGYDHDHPTDRGRMARVERRLRAQGGLPAGLIERAPAMPASPEQAPAARARRRRDSRRSRTGERAGGGAPASTEQAPAARARRRSGVRRSRTGERARAGGGAPASTEQ